MSAAAAAPSPSPGPSVSTASPPDGVVLQEVRGSKFAFNSKIGDKNFRSHQKPPVYLIDGAIEYNDGGVGGSAAMEATIPIDAGVEGKLLLEPGVGSRSGRLTAERPPGEKGW